jgi:predicted acyl esterase
MRVLSALLFIAFPFISFSQQIDSAWFVNNYTKIEQQIPMRDGKKLFTSIYVPKNKSEKHPILMMRTPYGVFPYGKEYRRIWGGYYKAYISEG